MDNREAVNWLIDISAEIGKAEYSDLWHYEQALTEIKDMLESAQLEERTKKHAETRACDLISRQQVLAALEWKWAGKAAIDAIKDLPSVQPVKETPKRVLWSGWKGMRDTRYKCPNCKKPVRSDDTYCHRCGQKLMFPNISFTPYVEGQKQELIVRWDDEGVKE